MPFFLTPFPEPWLDLAREASIGNRGLGELVEQVASDMGLDDGGLDDVGLDLGCLLAMRRPTDVRSLLDQLPDGDRSSTEGRLLGSIVEARRGDLGAALEVLGGLIHRARIDARERTLVWALLEGGRAAGIGGAKVQSLEWLEEGIEIARRLDLLPAQGLLLACLGMIYGQEGRSADYARYTQQALAVARAMGDEQTVALTLCNLAGAWCTMGRLRDASDAYEEAMVWAQEHGHLRLQALIHAGRGGVAFQRGAVAQGREAYGRSARVLHEVGDHFQVARQAMLVAQALQGLERFAEAREAYEEGIELAEAHGLTHLVVPALGDLAECQLRLGETEAAHEAFRACIRLQRVDLDAQVRAVRVEAGRAHATLLAMKEAGWERERRVALEASHAELQKALSAQSLLRQELEEASRTDALTGLPNRRAFDQRMRFVRTQAERYGRATSLMLVDVDHFKRVNDAHGHDVGDEVLVGLGRRVSGAVRGTDLLARWGGEEFVVLLPETSVGGAAVCARKLVDSVRSAALVTRAGPLRVTVSVGVATVAPGEVDADLLRRADAALYCAKEDGRDRVVVWDPTLHSSETARS